MGARIVVHSFRLLWINLANALRVSIGPFVAGLVACMIILLLFGLPIRAIFSVTGNPAAVAQVGGGGVFLAVILCLLVMLFVSSWVAVAWHRFVLLEEYPGMLPELNGKPIWPYAGRAVLLSLIIIVLAIPAGLIIGIVMYPFIDATGNPPLLIGLVVSVIMGGLLGWIWMRLGLSLPATAISRPLGFGESWARTKPLASAIFVAVLILAGLNIVVSLIFELVLGANLVTALLGLIVNWVSLMVGISILTTLYGIAIEGRSVD